MNDNDTINLLYFCQQESILITEGLFGPKKQKTFFVVIQTGERFRVDQIEGPGKTLNLISKYARKIGLKNPKVKVVFED